MAVLQITYDYIRRAVGRHLGIGRNPMGAVPWTSDNSQDVADIIDTGMRRFYWPPQHSWSFLRPFGSLVLVPGQRAYELPSTFGGGLEAINFAENSKERPLKVVTLEDMRAAYANADASGSPQYFALQPRIGTGGGTCYDLLVYPVPTEAKTLTYRYTLNPPTLDADNPSPLGGPQHAETILEGILAAAEEFLDDSEQIHAKRFAECLAVSIALDQELFST
jgi:hypothetical protein